MTNIKHQSAYKECSASKTFTSFLNVSTKYFNKTLSKSSPPNIVSPLVDLTSKTPFWISKMDISNVPPPRSYTAILN